MNEIITKGIHDHIFLYYQDANFLTEIPASTHVYYMYMLDLESRLEEELDKYNFEERGEEGRLSDYARAYLETETMTIVDLEIIMYQLGLFFLNNEGRLLNQPFQTVW